jgi:lactoylglutathione lyase
MSDPNPVQGLSFRIHHTMLPVADLDRSIDFYTRLLGMTVMGRRFNEARKTEVGHVGYGDRWAQPSIELTKDASGNAPGPAAPTGIHVAIQVDDLRRLHEILAKEGVAFDRPPTGRPGSRNLTAWIRDPDGNELELVERHPEP